MAIGYTLQAWGWLGQPATARRAVCWTPGDEPETVGRTLGIQHDDLVRQVIVAQRYLDAIHASRLVGNQSKTSAAVLEN